MSDASGTGSSGLGNDYQKLNVFGTKELALQPQQPLVRLWRRPKRLKKKKKSEARQQVTNPLLLLGLLDRTEAVSLIWACMVLSEPLKDREPLDHAYLLPTLWPSLLQQRPACLTLYVCTLHDRTCVVKKKSKNKKTESCLHDAKKQLSPISFVCPPIQAITRSVPGPRPRTWKRDI